MTGNSGNLKITNLGNYKFTNSGENQLFNRVIFLFDVNFLLVKGEASNEISKINREVKSNEGIGDKAKFQCFTT